MKNTIKKHTFLHFTRALCVWGVLIAIVALSGGCEAAGISIGRLPTNPSFLLQRTQGSFVPLACPSESTVSDQARPSDYRERYSISGNISTDSERDAHRVFMTKGRGYRVALTRLNGNFDPMLRIYYHPSDTDRFVGDNNGASAYQDQGNALLYIKPCYSGYHTVEASSAMVISNNTPKEFTGDYQLVIEPSEGLSYDYSELLPKALSQPAANYELAVAEEFTDSTRIFSSYQHKGVHPAAIRYSFADSLRRSVWAWPFNIPSTVRFIDYGAGSNGALLQTVSIPKYSEERAIFSRYGTIISDTVSSSPGSPWHGLLLTNRQGSYAVWDGQVLQIDFDKAARRDLERYKMASPPITRESETGGKTQYTYDSSGDAAYFASYLWTRDRFHTRYGYFEARIDYSDMLNFDGFGHALWLQTNAKDQGTFNSHAEVEQSIPYRGVELDMVETGVPGGKNRLRWHFRYHAFRPGSYDLDHYIQREITYQFAKIEDAVVIWGMEWTPTDLCMYVNREPIGCVSGSHYRKKRNVANHLVTHAPLYFILSTTGGSWTGDGQSHHAGLLSEYLRGGTGESGAVVDYLRIFKPRDRYQDTLPDNTIIHREVNSVADLAVREND